ncbi:MAG: SMP-30/gluconolactonase/LRE family protein [Kordiimonadaceae bacterium]|nr:SMP-30/gluconolactonase/LRE family protein [Kordiimonadaceae bacterium]
MQEHQTKILADGFGFLEGPRWHNGELWLSDMWDSKVFRVTLDGKRDVVCEVPGRPCGLGFLPDGTPLVVSMNDRKIMRIEKGEISEYADLSNLATGDANDMLVDQQGRAYVGNMGYDLFGGEEAKLADFIVVDPRGTATVAATGLEFVNGIALIDEGRTLVLAETWQSRLLAFDRAADGSLSNRRVFADLGERTPDGICADQKGGIWVSSVATGEFLRVVDGGEVTDRVLCEGKRAVACALGGDDGRTLFCLTFEGTVEEIFQFKNAGVIETVRVDVAGV